MNFRTATDLLLHGISQGDLAKKLEVSTASIRQARLNPKARAYRSPPQGWEEAVSQLAGDQIRRLRSLLTHLRARQQLDLIDEASRPRRGAGARKQLRTVSRAKVSKGGPS